MLIFERIDCPRCSRKDSIRVIVENNVVTSHGICAHCDKTFGPDLLQFHLDTFRYESQYLEMEAERAAEEALGSLAILQEVEDEVFEFNNLVWLVFFDELYQIHVDEMDDFIARCNDE